MSGWDSAETAACYEAFCRSNSRYIEANSALIAHAALEPHMQLLDLGAGTGRTAGAALPQLGNEGRVLCIEPHAGLRNMGIRRIIDPRVRWSAQLPDTSQSFDRILCGAAIWQVDRLAETLQLLAGLLRPGGAICFNIPALYLQEPEEPGGGSDPYLLSLPDLLLARSDHDPAFGAPVVQASAPLSASLLGEWLVAAGLRPVMWDFRLRITQDAYAEWLKIPVTSDRLFGDLSPGERAQRIETALRFVDRRSWKWEPWRGWTAWKT